jgi:nitroreductase
MNKLKEIIISIIRSEIVLNLASKSRFLTHLYYAFLWPAFAKEEYAILYGIRRYQTELVSDRRNQYLLRRNIHRLEKGLLMRPRKDTFGLTYIADTVLCYKLFAANPQEIAEEELMWAHDVLQEYFQTVHTHPEIDRAKEAFLSLSTPAQESRSRLVPHRRVLSTSPPVTYDALSALAERRRSVRWYLDRPVPRELIDKAIAVAAQSPSACNRQPFEFYIFDEPDEVETVAELALGAQGFRHNIPVIGVLVGKLRAYFDERDRHLIYIDCSLAAMSFMYALETLGLASCALNWPDVRRMENKMASLLNLEPDERVIMLISLGYPDPSGMVAHSQKKSINQLRRYNPS